jgi:hypothetical protein
MVEPDSNDAFDLDGPACRWHKARYTTAGRHPLADFLLKTALRAGSSQAFEHVASIGNAVPELAAYPIEEIRDAQDAIDAGHPQLLALLLVRLRASLDLNTWQKLHQRALAARQRLHGTDSEALSAADACLESLAHARRAVRATSMHFELVCALVETGLSYQEAQQAFGVFAEVAADASDAGAQLEAYVKQLALPQAEVLRQFCQKL